MRNSPQQSCRRIKSTAQCVFALTSRSGAIGFSGGITIKEMLVKRSALAKPRLLFSDESPNIVNTLQKAFDGCPDLPH